MLSIAQESGEGQRLIEQEEDEEGRTGKSTRVLRVDCCIGGHR